MMLLLLFFSLAVSLAQIIKKYLPSTALAATKGALGAYLQEQDGGGVEGVLMWRRAGAVRFFLFYF